MDEQEKELERMERDRLQILGAYASFFQNSADGQRILVDLKKSLDQPTYRPGRSTDEVIWREGRRSVYLDIVAAVGVGVEAIETLSTELPTHAEGLGPAAAGEPLD